MKAHRDEHRGAETYPEAEALEHRSSPCPDAHPWGDDRCHSVCCEWDAWDDVPQDVREDVSPERHPDLEGGDAGKSADHEPEVQSAVRHWLKVVRAA